MSNIEERVVVLKFDNSSFEQNTRQSMKTLDDLNGKLDKSNAAKGLKNLTAEANSIDLSNVSKAADTINKRFSTMGVVGAAALNKITDAAVSYGKKIVTSIPTQIWQGGWQRALNIEQAKFQIEGLGKLWDESSVSAKAWAKEVEKAGSEAKAALKFGKTVEEGKQAFQDMKWDEYVKKMGGKTAAEASLLKNNVLDAVKGTAAGLDEAGKVASQLAASGMKAGTEMTESLRGIAGASAMTGDSFSNIGNIFTTVAGNGRLMTEQLNQFASRGLNAAATLTDYLNKNKAARDAAIETGLASKHGAKDVAEFADATKLTEANIRTLVTAGGISFKTFSHAMSDAFGEHATKANETYTGSLANMKAALSRIGADVQTQRLENLRKIFNTLTPIIDGIHDKLGPFIEKINKASSKVTEFFIGGLNKVAKAFGWIKDEDSKASKATDKVKDIAGKALKGVAGDAKDTGKTLHLTSKEFQAAMDIWNKGTYGNGEERVKGLKAVGLNYHRVQSFINAACEAEWNLDKVNYKVTDNMTKSLKKVGDAAGKNNKLTKEEIDKRKQLQAQLIAEKKAYDGLSGPAKVLFNIVRSFKNVVSGFKSMFSAIRTAFQKVFNPKGIKDSAFSLFQLIGKGVIKLSELIAALTGKFAQLMANEKVVNFFVKFFQVLRAIGHVIKVVALAIFNFVKNMVIFIKNNETARRILHLLGEAFKKIGLMIQEAATRIYNFFKNIKEHAQTSKLAQAFRNLWEAIKPLASLIFNKIADGLEKFIHSTGKASVIDFLASAINKLAGYMSKVINLASGGVHKITDFFGAFGKAGKPGGFKMGFLGKVIGQTEETQSGLAKFLGAIKRLDFKTALGALVEALKTGFSKLGELASGGKIGKVFETIKNGFGKFDIDKALDRAWKISKIFALVKSVVDLGKVSKSAAGALTSIGGFFSTLSGTLKQYAKQRTKAMTFRDIAIGVVLIAAAALIISKIDKEGLKKAGIVIGSFLGAMILIMIFLSKLRADQMLKSAAVLIAIGASVLMVAIAMKKVAGLSWPSIGKAIFVIGLFIGIFLTVSAVASRLEKGSVAFASMALAIDLLLPALIILAKMPGESIMKGGAAILYLAIIMGVASRIASSNKKGSMAFIAMALAITAMVPAIVALAMLPFERAAKAVAMLSILLLVLSGSARLAASSKTGVMSMLSMATVIGTLTAALVILSFIPWPKLLMAAAALTSVFVAFGFAGKAAEASKTGIVLMIAMFGLLLAAILLLSKMHLLNQAILFAFSLAILAAALGVACALLSKIPIPAALAAVANLGIMIFGLVGILAALGGLSKIPGLKELIAGGEGLLGQIGHAIGYFIGSIIAGVGQAAAGTLATIADSITNFVKSMKPVLEIVSNIGKKPIEGFKNLAAAVLMITGAQFLDALLHIDSIKKMTTFAGQVDSLIDAFIPIVPKASKFNGKELDKFNKVAQAIKAFAGVAKAIPQNSKDSLATKLVGMKNLGTFGKQLTTFMENWGPVAEAVYNNSGENGVMSPAAMEHMKKTVAPAIKAYAEIAQAIPQNSADSLATAFLGMKDLGEFGKQIKKLMDSFTEAAPSAANLTPELCKHIKSVVVPCIETFAALNDKVPDGGFSLKSLFVGDDTNLADFGKDIKKMIDALVDAGDKVAGVKDFKGKLSALKKVKSVIEVFSALSETGGIKGGNGEGLVTMGKSIANMMPHIEMALTNIDNVGDKDKLEKLKTVGSSLPSLANSYAKATAYLDKKGSGKISTMASQLVEYAKQLNGMDTSNLSKNAKAVRDSIDKILGASSKNSKKSGKNMVTEYANSIKGGASYAKKAAKAVVAAAKEGLSSGVSSFTKQGKSVGSKYASGITAKGETAKKAGKSLSKQAKDGLSTAGWYKAGEDAGKGFIKGINSMKELVYQAGVSLGKQAVQGAKDATDESSPSKEFAKIGRFTGAGMLIGMRSYEDKVYKAGADLGLSALDGTDEAINDMSVDPTITPVLDLSDVANGAKRIGGLLDGQTVNPNILNNNVLMSDIVSKIDKLASKNTEQPMSITVHMNISGSDDPAAWGDRFVAEIRRKSRMGGI